MSHSHGSHSHGSAAAGHRGRLVAVLGASLTILAMDLIGGIVANSLALLADAGHVLTDIAGIGLALLAISFAGRMPTIGRTYGFLRLEILAALANGVLMFMIAAVVLVEAWQRLHADGTVGGGEGGAARARMGSTPEPSA